MAGCVCVGSVVLAASTLAAAQPPSAFQDKSTSASSQVSPADLTNVGIDQRLDQQVPLDLQFKDETGKTVKLGDYFHAGRPVHPEPGVLHLPDVVRGRVGWRGQRAGRAEVHSRQRVRSGVGELQSRRNAEGSRRRRSKIYIARMNEQLEHKTNGEGWHFLTGQQPEIKQLADAVGFHYRRDPRTGQFIHAAAIMIVTPTGQAGPVLLRG